MWDVWGLWYAVVVRFGGVHRVFLVKGGSRRASGAGSPTTTPNRVLFRCRCFERLQSLPEGRCCNSLRRGGIKIN
jgi:hypothetical protein